MEWTAIILAGGQSSRMGTNKAVLPLAGSPVIERIVAAMKKVTGHIVLSGGQSTAYAYLGLPVLQDIYPGRGPLAGLHAGLKASSTDWNLVVSCDMPFVNAPLMQYLACQAFSAEQSRIEQSHMQQSRFEQRFWDQKGKKEEVEDDLKEEGKGKRKRIEAIIPRVNCREHPLLAMYRRSVLPGLEQALKQGSLRVNGWSSELAVKYISGEELSSASGLPAEVAAFNMNRPEDYEAAKLYYEHYLL